MAGIKPEWLKIAEGEIGVMEITGEETHPQIKKYLESVNGNMALNDEIAWCSAFVNWVIQQSGYLPAETLIARDWLKWGRLLKNPVPGAIVVIQRGDVGWQGHVGFYISETKNKIRLLGGNQDNRVGFKNYDREKVLGYRWPLILEGIKANNRLAKVRYNEIVIGTFPVKDEPVKVRVWFWQNPKFQATIKCVGQIILGILQLIPQTSMVSTGVAGLIKLKEKKNSRMTWQELIRRLFELITQYFKR